MKENVLIPNIGRRGYLVRYLRKSPSFEGKIYVSDCDRTASGLYGDNDGAFILPKPIDDEEKYIYKLHGLCLKNNIRIVIPVIDPEIYILSKWNDIFRRDGIFVSVSSEKVLDICYNKLMMNDFLKTNGFDTILTFNKLSEFEDSIITDRIRFPVIVKPIYGSGSESTFKASNMDEVKAFFGDGMIIQEYIDGQEYGADIFNDAEGIPIRCVIKRKISMRSGETDKAKTIIDKNIRKILVSLGSKLGHICNVDCDIIEKHGHYYILDLNPRFGGGYPATHESGINLLEMVLKVASGKEVKPIFDNYESGVFTFKEISLVSTRELIR